MRPASKAGNQFAHPADAHLQHKSPRKGRFICHADAPCCRDCHFGRAQYRGKENACRMPRVAPVRCVLG